MKEWFEKSFQEDYLKIYAHRDEQKATQELESLISYLPLKQGLHALDLCCGQGRHSRWLAGQGLRVTGVDLSAVLLQEAIKHSLNVPVLYMRADARSIPFENEMDFVFNLFTSFGYFKEDEENEKVIKQASKALKNEGYFLMDYLNPGYLQVHLQPFSETQMGQLTIHQHRSINNQFVEKKIVIREEGESERHYEERVKLYSVDQMRAMLENNQLNVIDLFGNYDASEYHPTESPRMIFICQKRSR